MVATARKLTKHERLIKDIDQRQRSWDRAGRQVEFRKRDYRYWMLVRAGIWADHEETYQWWCRLHWMQREAWFKQHLTLLCVSKSDIEESAKEAVRFFRNTLKRQSL